MKKEPIKVKQLLQKARNAAILAVEFYNKPSVTFKSEGYITMMIIAWTSLFHACFLKNKVKPFYRKERSGIRKPRFERIIEILPNGKKVKEYKWWDLSKCIKEYFKADSGNPVKKNIEFFIPLRNMIQHRFIPQIDDTIFGECQALLINFNNFIEKHFGKRYSIKDSLSFSLQMAKTPANILAASKDELKKYDANNIINFIKAYRSSLTTKQFESPEYSFKAVLIQVRNHESKDALPIRFIHEKYLSEEQKNRLQQLGIVLVKEKHVPREEDKMLKEYKLTYKDLCNRLKKQIKNFKINPEKIEVIPNYIDTNLFKPLNLPKEKNSIIFVGRLEEQKNLFNLIEAIATLPVKLVIIGNGSLKEKLKNFAKEKNAEVEFKENVPNEKLPEELNKSEFFILPSFYEGCPKVLLEAMACGLPGIGTNVEGIKEIIQHKENGYLCKTDTESIRKAILEVLNDKNLQEKISQNARKTILERFSLEKILEKEIKLYQSL